MYFTLNAIRCSGLWTEAVSLRYRVVMEWKVESLTSIYCKFTDEAMLASKQHQVPGSNDVRLWCQHLLVRQLSDRGPESRSRRGALIHFGVRQLTCGGG